MNSMERTPLLEIEDATVRRGGRHILDSVSLRIDEGVHTAIVGPNGSGKTTLIKLISRQHYALARPNDAPSATIFGKSRWDVFELRQMMGIVSSDLHHDFIASGKISGLEVALSGFFASHGLARNHEVTPSMRSRAEEALALMEASHLAGKHMDEMSTGEARRVLIARALVPDPRALLLDEPTTGLDIAARHRFLETLRSIAQRGKTIILITHHVEEILPEIEDVILMSEGRIAAQGAKSDVLTPAKLSDVFGASVEVEKNGAYYLARVAEASR
jgi:iron complex transport system ATP-binding protein